jgi:hypothetical protein
MANKPVVQKLVIGSPGPFQVIENQGASGVDGPLDPPRRRYSCPNYPTCLDLAAALNWDNFTCRGCCGQIEEALFWRAHQAMKHDTVVRRICDLPDLQFHCSDAPEPHEPRLKVVNKD